MYIAMNRFKICLGREHDFEAIWRHRETNLDSVPGFMVFHLLKGEKTDNYTEYASHSTWRSNADFKNWTKSEAFRESHKDAGQSKYMYLGHPIFEGFEVVL